MEKIKKIDAPLLVVGLGGTGSEAAARIKKEFQARFEMAKRGNSTLDVPPHTAFLIFDTDKGEMTKRGWSKEEFRELQVDLDAVKNYDKRTGWEKPWFDTHFKDPEGLLSDGNGAGVFRQVSRMALFRTIDEVKSCIDTTVTNIRNLNATDEKAGRMHVILLAGLSGGTGSGTFLDMAYIIRKILKDKAVGGVRIEACLVMPDVTIANNAVGNPVREKLYKTNSYAALQELDFWMAYHDHHHRYTQKYNENLTITWDNSPFDDVNLLCAQRLDNSEIKNPMDHIMNVIAEYYVNYFSDDEEKRMIHRKDQQGNVEDVEEDSNGAETKSGYSFESARSNLLAQLNSLKRDYWVPYRYSSIGAYSNRGDEENILTIQWHLVYTEVEKTMKANPIDVTTIEGKKPQENIAGKGIGLDGSAIRKWYAGKQHPIPNLFSEEVTRKVMGKTTYEGAPNGPQFVTYKLGIDNTCGNDKKAIVEQAIEIIRTEMTAVITDPERGPQYAYDAMIHPQYGVLQGIKLVKDALPAAIAKCDEYVNAHQGPNGHCDHLRRDINSSLLGREARFQSYKQATERLWNAQQAMGYYNALKLAMPEIENYANKYMTLLGEMCEGLRKQKEAYDERMKHTAADNIQLLDAQKVTGTLVAAFQANENNKAAVQKVYNSVASMIDSAIEQEVLRLPAQKVAEIVTENLDGLRTSTFAGIAEQTMETRIATLGDLQGAGTIADYAETVLMPSMENGSMPMFTSNVELSSIRGNAIEGYMGTVPAQAVNIQAGIKNHLAGKSNYTNIKLSKIKDRIFWVNNVVGFPLLRYRLLDKCAEAYREMITTHGCTHLCMSGSREDMVDEFEQNWSYMPDPACPRHVKLTSVEEEVAALQKAGILTIDVSWDDYFTPITKIGYKGYKPETGADEISVEQMKRKIKKAENEDPAAELADLNKVECEMIPLEITDHLIDRAMAWSAVLGSDKVINVQMNRGMDDSVLEDTQAAWRVCYERAVYEYVARNPQLLNRMKINKECDALLKAAKAAANERGNTVSVESLKKGAAMFAQMVGFGKIVVGKTMARFVSDAVTEDNEIVFAVAEDDQMNALSAKYVGANEYDRKLQSLLYYANFVFGKDSRDSVIVDEVAEVNAMFKRCERNDEDIPGLDDYVAAAEKLKEALETGKNVKLKQLKAAGTISAAEFDTVVTLIDEALRSLKNHIFNFAG